MAHPKDLLWPCDLHTQAKHALLKGYLDAWFPILVQYGYSPITYFESFAGPGIYSGGEPGSPIVALRSFLDRTDRIVEQAKSVKIVLLEERSDRLQRLREEVAARFPKLPANVEVTYHEGRCETDALKVLGAERCWGGPVFAILDAWGLDVPLPVVARIAKNRSSEVLVTFTSSYLRRFPDDVSDKADRQVGSREWRKVKDIPTGEKARFVVDLYRTALKGVGLSFTLPFELLDEGGRELFLIFATGHRRGLERFKDSMWKVDPVRGVVFRDPRDRAQLTFDLFEGAELVALRRRILEVLTGAPRTVGELQEGFLQSVYRPPHVTTAVRDLITSGHVVAEPPRGKITKATRVRATRAAGNW